MKVISAATPGRTATRLPANSSSVSPPALGSPLTLGGNSHGHSFSQLTVHPAALPVVQLAKSKVTRRKPTDYQLTPYRTSSKFRFIRWRRRSLVGHTGKGKTGINYFTVKYKKNGKAYYLTTRSVPNTNQSSFVLPSGHSEERYAHLLPAFEKRHKLNSSHLQWGATEREPCGQGPGMANCRQTLHAIGVPPGQVHFGSEYADREDMRASASQTPASLNALASAHRHVHNQNHEENVAWIGQHHDSDTESEDESNVIDEYESDYGEYAPPRRKRPNPALKKAFRQGFDK